MGHSTAPLSCQPSMLLPWNRRGGCAIKRLETAQTGWSFLRHFSGPTTPAGPFGTPLRGLLSRPPLLFQEGTTLATQDFTPFHIFRFARQVLLSCYVLESTSCLWLAMWSFIRRGSSKTSETPPAGMELTFRLR